MLPLIDKKPPTEPADFVPRKTYLCFNLPTDDAIWHKSSTFALNALLNGIQTALNAKMLAQAHEDGGDAAGAIISTLQNITVGTSINFLLGTGLEMTKFMADKQYKQAGDLAKTSWALTLMSSMLITAIQLSSKWSLPYLYEEKAAQIAGEFLTGYAIGNIPGLMMATNLQIVFQTNDLDVSNFTVLLSSAPGVAFSYLLAFPGKQGAFGLGLGASLANIISYAFIQYWLSRKNYTDFEFYSLPLDNFYTHIKALIKTGSLLAFQRLTEWGNIFAITLILSLSAPRSSVSAIGPAIQYTAIVSLALQGLGNAVSLMIKRDKKNLENVGIYNTQGQDKLIKKIQHTLVTSNIAGIAAAAIIFITFYFARKPLCDFFLSNDAQEQTRELAYTFSWISMLGLIAEAPRIVSISALRSWGDILKPTLICLVLMSIIGIPIGYAASEANNDDTYFLTVRNIVISISALVLLYRCYQKLEGEKENFNTEISSPENISCCYRFLSASRRPNAINDNNQYFITADVTPRF